MTYLKPFSELGKNDAPIAGGKGASLGEMTQAGIPVPPGFVILADAFEYFISKTDLVQEIEAILGTVNHNEIHTVEKASESIQALILSREMPLDIQTEINASFKELNTKYVAVRSSATAEDGTDHAWAGQLESYLNTTEVDLLEKVKHCWASLFTPRAIFYRFEKGLHTHKISVAVVVQKMVESEISGIAFSVHPVTEDRNQIIIEAGFGLGEAIVSGQVTPDSYVVEKTPRKILDVNVATQSRALYRIEGGGNEWQSIPEPKASAQVMNESQILEFSELILKIENHYGFPCDIEWAYEAEKFYIVQSRPITTLSFENNDLLGIVDPQNYTFIGSYKTSPFGSAFWSSWYVEELGKEFGIHADFSGWLMFQGRHVFYNTSQIKLILQDLQSKVESVDVPYFENLMGRADQELNEALNFSRTIKGVDYISDFKKLIHYARRILFFWSLGWQLSQVLDVFLRTEAPKYGISPDKITEHIPHVGTPLVEQQESLKRIREMFNRKGFGNSNTKLLQQSILQDPELTQACEDHILKYAWVSNIDWQESAYTIDQLLEQISVITDTSYSGHTTPSDSPFKKYERILCAGSINQYGSEYLSMFAHNATPFLRSIAQKLNVSYDDFHLYLPTEVLHLLEQVTINDQRYLSRRDGNWCVYTESNNSTTIIDDGHRVRNISNLFLKKESEITTNELKGDIGNKGIVRGVVKVVHSAKDFEKFTDGDVLVTAMTTPDFIALMQRSVAVVTEMGGLLSHAAITAREIGKPCIIGTKVATQILKDGDMVEVDADNGVVRILGKTDPLGDIDSWQRLFRVQGLRFLISDIWMEHYRTLGTLVLYYEGEFISFLPKVQYEALLNEGREFFRHETAFSTYESAFRAYIKQAVLLGQIDTSEELSVARVHEVLRILSDLYTYYYKTEFFYTDEAYAHSKIVDDKEFNTRLERMGVLKNEGRQCLNTLFFGDDSILMQLLQKLKKKFDIDVIDLLQYSRAEILALFQGERVSQEQLRARNQAFYILGKGDSIEIKEGSGAHDSIVCFLRDKNNGTERTIKGIVANQGKNANVVGTARIFKMGFDIYYSLGDRIDTMQNGDILIAETTSPEYMQACLKAGAIVTDQGGMLSHAAIVSRELGISCIVGTGNATELIADGDTVEVDTSLGIIRIIEKA